VELTAYAAAWKTGSNTVEIPLSYVTRAAMIWRNGEQYRFVPTNPPPACWVPLGGTLRTLAALDGARAVRSAAGNITAGASTEITISVLPPGGVGGYAVEERIPAGWTATNISDDGTFGAASGVIRWGIFLDGQSRTVSYRLSAPGGICSIGDLEGQVSFDGENETVGGATRLIAADTSAALSVAQCERRADGTVALNLAGPAGQVCILEASADLQSWDVVDEVFLPDGELSFVDNTAAGQRRFYRLRVR
jgi:hypothetical protein